MGPGLASARIVGSGGPEKESTGQPSFGPVWSSLILSPYNMLLVAEGQLH
ncbi:BZ3500_MvSof-1268-A1-R1_Chr8-1g09899 [Microbotryum saponariae]|uniref:BZ3500_MvSof-1268-A1-R1_Chr8-1g09899 protein n=1 Tax=Microbotryum saponariae TaxID=289078 RepID=A0A2X0MFT7_9BASI|nr:BZ3500_MvSof-1268-A1-R1_Chr8-1g09899 [Microbotryum saponariae]SDA08185.1 BZ3501_MvSof-1269-A2-R1_Chr8-1g09622 [Microbotryum saponariae]